LANNAELCIRIIIVQSMNERDSIAPVAERIEKELVKHSDIRIDPYFWMNDRENPNVIDYLNAENDYTNSYLSDYKDFRENLFQELVSRIKQTDESVPYFDNGYFYISRFEEGKEYPIYSRKKGSLDAPEEIMLDVNEMAKGHAYYQVGGLSVSPDNRWLAFGVDNVSRRQYKLYFKNLETDELLPQTIENTSGYAAWGNDNRTLFYTAKNPQTLRTDKIFRHILGETAESDILVYEETDETFYTTVYKTKSEKFIMIASSSTLTSEYQYLDADKPEGKFTVFHPRERELEYSVDHYKDKFYIVTNWNAKNFRLMVTSLNKTTKDNWTELIAHRPDVLLEDIEIFSHYLVVGERKNGLINLRIINWKTKEEHYLDFGEEDYTAGVSINPDFESNTLRYSYTSLTTPRSVYDYNMDDRSKVLLKEQEVLGDFDKSNYEAKRLYANSRDGKQIPVSIVYRKGIEKDGNNPTLLYGYGSYGINIDPYFSSSRLSLLDRGFIFVIAHIRGSETLGRQWYDDGKMMAKMNTFNDFIDCAQFIINEHYTSPNKLFAQGGSAGGLLMGAVANMAPQLFKGILADVPFVDVVTTMLDESIPLTTGEYDEWGDPNKEESYFYMKSYSPYDNVTAQNYPSMLVTTGLYDSQVQYWEPAKWVAKLRYLKTDRNPLLLHTNMDAGHGGASGRFEQFKEVALEYAFMFKLLGIKK
jgi:oligopeptidase B